MTDGGSSVNLTAGDIAAGRVSKHSTDTVASERASRVAYLGWLPPLTATASVGVTLVVAGDALSRSIRSSSQSLFWIGLLTIYLPITLRLASAKAARAERLALVLLLGLSLYVVKVLRDPFGFTYADELLHAPNVNVILQTHELFHRNALLPVTSDYPGLESVTAGLASMSGLSSFGAGLIVIGAARLVITLALFLLFERLSGSDRVAALGAVTYAGNANYFFFSAQFSYESLALPLLVVLLLAVREWRDARSRTDWSLVVALLTVAIVATHHLTSYALVIALFALSLITILIDRSRGRRVPWRFAYFALLAAASWLTLVASETVGYLTPLFHNAFFATIHTATGESAPRKLFSSVTGYHAPLLERGVAFGSVALLALAFPFGLFALLRRHRNEPLALLFALAGCAFFGTVLLRFAPMAWEFANRASEFVFVGLAFVTALCGLDRLSPRRVPWFGAAAMASCLAVVFAGGVIAGWNPSLRLAQPYRIKAGSRIIDSEGRELARWVSVRFGSDRQFVASESDARLLNTYAAAFAVQGSDRPRNDALKAWEIEPWELELLRRDHIHYVVVDLRQRSFDNAAGYFFGRRPGAGVPDTLLSENIAKKFNELGYARLYDTGDIVVYRLGAIR
jgi:hypothetical protein